MLSASYHNGVRIHGLIYLHRISDNRVSGSSKKGLQIFKSVCGSKVFHRVALCTTMWDTEEAQVAKDRETQLLSEHEYFGDLTRSGAHYYRLKAHNVNRPELISAALSVLRTFVGSQVVPVGTDVVPIILQIQRELVNEGKKLSETSAGTIVAKELLAAQESAENEIRQAQDDLNEALRQRDQASVSELESLRQHYDRKLADATNAQQQLTSSLTEMHELEMKHLVQRLDAMEEQWKSGLREKQKELTDLESSLDHIKHQQTRKQRSSQPKIPFSPAAQTATSDPSSIEDQVVKEFLLQQKLIREKEKKISKLHKEVANLEQKLSKKQETTQDAKQRFGADAFKGIAGGVASGVAGAGKLRGSCTLPTEARLTHFSNIWRFGIRNNVPSYVNISTPQEMKVWC